MDCASEELEYGSALHWYDSDNKAWVRYDGRLKAWRGWAEARSEELPVRPREWRPWSELVDASTHPYIRWFKNASTNITFTALDGHLLSGHGSDAGPSVAAPVTSCTQLFTGRF
mmetsp:Transcript_10209/g.33633  ORF Transcript_10209/g.33633 Transcript_10209/m.33633 type:complete len:114 (-) Transcript_10209:6240-6581(-)